MRRRFYDNEIFNNVDCGGYDKSVVKGQFPTGCADPYIMRFNGTYYLYVTTSGLENRGLRAWKSTDLLHWEKCQGKGLKEGYVIDDNDADGRYTQNAYAPEVYYFNGKFYMIISPGPAAVSPERGHRILVASSPEGPFQAHSGQIDTRIDGTLLIDDDETVYFAHATPKGITIHEFTDMKQLGEGALIAATDGTGAWTEGPGITKVRGHYYLTYTGCHYQTPGYQVLYATCDHLDKTNIQTVADSFKRGPSRIVLLNCDKNEGHVGLGHSINFMGPDLDSYYICYHNLDALYEDGMTHRSFNIDRLLLNHGLMTSLPRKNRSIYPSFPFFQSRGLEGFKLKDGIYLSKKNATPRFSCEFNSRGGKQVKYIFAYEDEHHYCYIRLDYPSHEIVLYRVEWENESVLARGSLRYLYNIDDMQTIRIAYDGELNVYFNNLRKISLKVNLAPGRMGYAFEGKHFEIGYSAISSHANGSSDKQAIKYARMEIPAFDCLEEDLDFVSLTGIRSEYQTTKAVHLKKGDTLSFPLYFDHDDHYELLLTLPKASLNKKLCCHLDESRTISTSMLGESEEDIVCVDADFGFVEKGLHTMIVEALDEMTLVSLRFAPSFNDYHFKGKVDEGCFVTDGFMQQGDELVVQGRRNFAPLSSQLLTNVRMSARIRLDSITEEKGSIGLMVRQDNYAYSDVPKQDFKDANTHIQGYYLEIKEDRINLSKYNFGDVKSYVMASYPLQGLLGQTHDYVIEAKGNLITVFLDGKQILSVIDPLPFHVGACALYAYRSVGAFADIQIDTI